MKLWDLSGAGSGKIPARREVLRKIFNRFDRDHSGTISADEAGNSWVAKTQHITRDCGISEHIITHNN